MSAMTVERAIQELKKFSPTAEINVRVLFWDDQSARHLAERFTFEQFLQDAFGEPVISVTQEKP